MRMLVAALVLTGCAHGVGIDIGEGFSDTESELIWEAVDEWPPDVYPDKMIHIVKVDALPTDHTDWINYGHSQHDEILLTAIDDPVIFRRVVAHELGHQMGLHHINVRPSIMNADVILSTDTPQEFDIAIARSNARR